MTLHKRLSEATEGTRGHTPGPWIEQETESSADFPGLTGWQDVGPADGKPVAIALGYSVAWSDHEADANAALIAAAPELLAALTELLDAAEADYGIPDDGDEDDEAVAHSEAGPFSTTFGQMRRARAAIAKATASPDTGEGG